MDDWLNQQLVPLITTWSLQPYDLQEQRNNVLGLQVLETPNNLVIDEIIRKRYALDRMHYEVFKLKQVAQAGALPAERLDVSFEQQLVEKDLEKKKSPFRQWEDKPSS